MSKQCSRCGETVGDGLRFCPNCGNPVTNAELAETTTFQKLCPGCGKPITGETKFCTNCGAPVSNGSSISAVQSQQTAFETNNFDNTESVVAESKNIGLKSSIMSNDNKKKGSKKQKEKKEKKPRSKGKTIALSIICLLICAAGVVSGYYLVNNLTKDDNSALESVASESKPKVTEESKADDTSSVEESASKLEWETKSMSEPVIDTNYTEKVSNGTTVYKINTGMSGTTDSITAYIDGDTYYNGYKKSSSEKENIYAKRINKIDYCGYGTSYSVNGNNSEKGSSFTVSTSTLTAIYNGNDKFSFEITADNDDKKLQEKCFNAVSQFMNADMAEYLVYSEHTSPKIMDYTFTSPDNVFTVTMHREIIENTSMGNYTIKMSVEYSANMGIKYGNNSETDYSYLDGGDYASLYNSAMPSLSSLLGSQVGKVSGNSSHDFMTNVLKNNALQDHKFIDTRLESLDVEEETTADGINTVTYNFTVSGGLKDIAYSSGPQITGFYSIAKQGENTNFALSIDGKTASGSNETDTEIQNAIEQVKTLFPNSELSEMTLENVKSKFDSSQPFTLSTTAEINGMNTTLSISITHDTDNGDVVEYSVTGSYSGSETASENTDMPGDDAVTKLGDSSNTDSSTTDSELSVGIPNSLSDATTTMTDSVN